MGYTTHFDGKFELSKPLTPEHQAYLEAFANTRRMTRIASKAGLLPDPIRHAAKLVIGFEGAYFVGGRGFMGQDDDPSVIDHNSPPAGQPGLWCKWVPTEDGTAIAWNDGEKFYNYIEWIEYLIKHFLAPWGYKLNGEMTWEGEEQEDIGKISIENNVVKIKHGRIVFD